MPTPVAAAAFSNYHFSLTESENIVRIQKKHEAQKYPQFLQNITLEINRIGLRISLNIHWTFEVYHLKLDVLLFIRFFVRKSYKYNSILFKGYGRFRSSFITFSTFRFYAYKGRCQLMIGPLVIEALPTCYYRYIKIESK